MASSKQPRSAQNRLVYSEFGLDKSSARRDNQGRSPSKDAPKGVPAEGIDHRVAALSRPELPAAQQDLRVQASRKGRKGKTVTLITGFQAQPETLVELAKKLKAQCGAGGTVKDQEIEVQGDHCRKVVQVLSQLGYKVKVSGG